LCLWISDDWNGGLLQCNPSGVMQAGGSGLKALCTERGVCTQDRAVTCSEQLATNESATSCNCQASSSPCCTNGATTVNCTSGYYDPGVRYLPAVRGICIGIDGETDWRNARFWRGLDVTLAKCVAACDAEDGCQAYGWRLTGEQPYCYLYGSGMPESVVAPWSAVEPCCQYGGCRGHGCVEACEGCGQKLTFVVTGFDGPSTRCWVNSGSTDTGWTSTVGVPPGKKGGCGAGADGCCSDWMSDGAESPAPPGCYACLVDEITSIPEGNDWDTWEQSWECRTKDSTRCIACADDASSRGGIDGQASEYTNADPPATASGDCIACEAGQHADVHTLGAVVCIDTDGCDGSDCGAGGECIDVAAPGAGYSCICTSGYYASDSSSSQVTCAACPFGTRASPGSTTCISCARGQYGGTFEDPTPTDTCSTCTPGKYSEVAGSLDESGCIACAAGRYSENSEFCRDCSTGQYSQNVRDSWNCKPCAAGQHTTNRTVCADCAAGKWAGRAVVAASDCTNCAAGMGSPPKSTTQAACAACGIGRYSSEGQDCTDCAAGQKSASGSRRICTPKTCQDGVDCGAHAACSSLMGTDTKCEGMYTTLTQTECEESVGTCRNVFGGLTGATSAATCVSVGEVFSTTATYTMTSPGTYTRAC
jgi:hypothetical protein